MRATNNVLPNPASPGLRSTPSLTAPPPKQFESALVWLRRDLRMHDNAALSHALNSARRVFVAFVFDREILDALDDRADRRVEFIWESVAELHQALTPLGGGVIVRYGHARDEIPKLAAYLKVGAVFANRDYEPVAVTRDRNVHAALEGLGIDFISYKDQVVFEQDEILTQEGRPYTVFTAYKNAWLKRVTLDDLSPHPLKTRFENLARHDSYDMPSLKHLGFERTNLNALGIVAGMSGARKLFNDFLQRIDVYNRARDYPAIKGPSYLSVHLRFGTISVRTMARAAWQRGGAGAETWLNELIWRDFYFAILHHHPYVVSHAFREEFDTIVFKNNAERFAAWCQGRTGYPLIDAAMHQLNSAGYMHNRLRMVTASFLVKDLHVDWRWGEGYFAQRLIDFDLAANNGGWQWAASTGCDAQPYFRIFNPVTQSEKFDPDGKFIRKYLPQLAACDSRFIHMPWLMSEQQQTRIGVRIGHDYPAPIVDHAKARRITLDLYAFAKYAHSVLQPDARDLR